MPFTFKTIMNGEIKNMKSLSLQLAEKYGIPKPTTTTKKVAIIDTETLSITEPRVYDIGVLIADLKGNVILKKQFVVDEVISSKKMQTAFYSGKLPEYEKRINENALTVGKFWEIQKEVNAVLNDFNVKTIGAYNLPFDERALAFSSRQYKYMQDGFITRQHQYDRLDLWTLACRYIASMPEYHDYCVRNSFYSKAGNLTTNAEIMYSFLINNPKYKEEHISIDDCEIEYEILNFILTGVKPKPKFTELVNDVQHMPFRLSNFDKSILLEL